MKFYFTLLTVMMSNLLLTAQSDGFDWQGHRGCRGLMPENTIPAFLHALDYPVTTLELDVVVTKDSVVVISHEPWFSDKICSGLLGAALSGEEGKQLNILDLTYWEIKNYDCGLRGNPDYPSQQKLAAYKPSLRDMVMAVEQQCINNWRAKPRYNIEIKSEEKWYGKMVPFPAEHVRIVLEAIQKLPIQGRFNIQSFDMEILKEVKKQAPDVMLAYLTANIDGVENNLAKLGFQPEIYSPYHILVTKKMVENLHARDIKVIPWTVNETKLMKKLIRKGVDGIITDYPNLITSLK